MSRFTVEQAAFATILVLATFTRLASLGSIPLTPAESQQALQAFQLLRGGEPTFWHEPLVVQFTSLLFLLFGTSDVTARLGSLGVGIATLLSLWWWRPMLGRGPVLAAALLLTLSPSLTFIHRTLAGGAHAAFLALALVLVGLRFASNPFPFLFLMGTGLTGLLLTTGPAGLSAILIFASYLLLRIASERAWLAQLISAKTWGISTQALALFALTPLIVVTAGFRSIEGLSALSLVTWAKSFALTNPEPWYTIWLLPLTHEPLILGLGLIGGLCLSLKNEPQKDPLHRFLLYWGSAAFLLYLLGGQGRDNLVGLWIIPFGLLGGIVLARFLSTLRPREWWPWGLWIVLPLILIVVALLALNWFTRPGTTPSWYEWAFVIAVALLPVAILLSFPLLWRAEAAGLSFGLVLALGGLYTIHALFLVNYSSSPASLLAPERTSPLVKTLASELSDELREPQLARQPLVLDTELPAFFAWYLRERPATNLAQTPELNAPLVLTIPQEGLPASQDQYAMISGRAATRWAPSFASFSDFWRWLAYRSDVGELETTQFTLYRQAAEN